MTKFTLFQFFLMTLLFILYFLLIKYLHPIIILILIMIYSSIICFLMSTWSNSFMYSIMLFLIMVSGMLIMFLYFSSLISNYQTKFMFNTPLMMSFFLNIMILLFFLLNYYFKFPPYKFQETSMSFLLNNNLFNNILYIFYYPHSNITMICMLYLLLSLFTIIKICSIKMTALRKLN